MVSERDAVKLYLGYPSKAMTIMGILSGFSVGCALVVGKAHELIALSTAAPLYVENRVIALVFSVALLVAALFFYRQRSELAWHYGQIILSDTEVRSDDALARLENADAWPTWLNYHWGFFWLFEGFAAWLAGAIQPLFVNLTPTRLVCGLGAEFVAAGIVMLRVRAVLKGNPSNEDPLGGWRWIFKTPA